MIFSELQLKRMIDKGYENFTIEDEISFNILNFIKYIHLNQQDFYAESFNSQYFGDVEMTFKKDANSLIGHCRVVVKKDNRTIDYLFMENGFEELGDILQSNFEAK
jgi:hypothetical protein